jgi:hypothetical protein
VRLPDDSVTLAIFGVRPAPRRRALRSHPHIIAVTFGVLRVVCVTGSKFGAYRERVVVNLALFFTAMGLSCSGRSRSRCQRDCRACLASAGADSAARF